MATLSKQQVEQIISSAPQGTSPAGIVAALRAKGHTLEGYDSAPASTPNYAQRLGADYTTAGKNIISGIQKGADSFAPSPVTENPLGGMTKDIAKRSIALAETGLNTVGNVAGAAFAPIVEAPGIKQGLSLLGQGIAKIPGVSEVVKHLSDLAIKHPDAANDINNAVNVLSLGVGSGAGKVGGEVLSNTGKALEQSGTQAAKTATAQFAQKLVAPVETAAEKLSQVGRTKEGGGLFKKDIVTPTPSEVSAANAVSEVPGISPSNTFQKNFNLVSEHNVKQATQLESDVKKYDFLIPKKETVSRIDTVAKDLMQNNPLIVGDASKTAARLVAGAKQIISRNDGTGSGLLKARKEYDQWVLQQKPKAFDAKAENAFTVANRAIRSEMNNLLQEKAPNLGIKDSLAKQSSLYNAMENIAPKAAQEANTPIGRAFQSSAKILGTKNKIVQAVAAAAGIGGLGAAATFAPAAVVLGGAGFLAYKAGKLVMKPEVRVAIGKLLQTSGHLLNPEDKQILANAIRTYQEIPNKSGGFVRINGKEFKEIPEATKKEMIDVIDYLRIGRETKGIENTISRLVEKYNINPDWSGAKLASVFEKLIEHTKTSQSVAKKVNK